MSLQNLVVPESDREEEEEKGRGGGGIAKRSGNQPKRAPNGQN